MRIDLKVDDTRLLRRLRNPEKRIAFAVVNAINATAKTAQRAVQLHVQETFTVRQPQFILRQAAIIKPFASVTQGRAYAELSVGRRSRLLLPTFEAGGERRPFKGKRSVAVPVEARPTKAAPVSPEFYVARLGFRRPKATTTRTRRARRAGGRRIFEGALGTYLIPGIGIFQRVGRAASRVLYVFSRPFRLRPLLKFEETVRRTALREFPSNLRREIADTLARIR